MSIQRLTVDRAALPAELLPVIKEHLRVRHTRDDALITTYTAAAISLIERQCNVTLDPATYLVSLDELTGQVGGWLWRSWVLPVNNVSALVVNDGQTPPGDYSASFDVWNADPGGNANSLVVSTGGAQLGTGWTLTLTAGVAAAADLAPSFLALISRMVGSLYEQREASSPLWAETWAAELSSMWRPTA